MKRLIHVLVPFTRLQVVQNQKALLFRDQEFLAIVAPGASWHFDPLGGLRLEIQDLNKPLFDHPIAQWLRQERPSLVAQHFEVMDLGEDEVGLRYENDVLVDILPPGSRRLYWKGPIRQRLDRVDLRQGPEVPADVLARLQKPLGRGTPPVGNQDMVQVQVPAFHLGVLKVDGQVTRLLTPGPAAFWRYRRQVEVDLVDTRLQAMEVSGQEILTRDKVGLRINLGATWRYGDVDQAFRQYAKPEEFLYREIQFGLRAAVGTRTLDELLEDKRVIDQVVSEHLSNRLVASGLEVAGIGVRDIVLPGEMKTLLAQVVEAEKAAQANVIRRREETAATRSLLNTAKVMEENPVALRLKELETLERIAERIDRISVFGGLDQVLDGLIRIQPKP